MPDSVSPQFRVARVDCALQDRIIGAQAAFARSRWFAFYLESGEAVAQTAAGDIGLSGPAVLWGPLEARTRLRIGAGSVGHSLFMSERLLEDAIGSVAEAAELRRFAGQVMAVPLDGPDRPGMDLDRLFLGIAAEARGTGFGQEIVVSGLVRLLLVALWRSRQETGKLGRTTAAGGGREINRFRDLVEARFRSRWKAHQYAEALGMSYDRLHDLCVRVVGRPPAQLIRERSLHEAQILLHRTTLSSERIAEMLGFASASNFSHFFRALTGTTPGAYRRTTGRETASGDLSPSFADWP